MLTFGSLRTHNAISRGNVDMPYCVYQPIGDWLRHVEASHGTAVMQRCQTAVKLLGLKENNTVCEVSVDRLDIISLVQTHTIMWPAVVLGHRFSRWIRSFRQKPKRTM